MTDTQIAVACSAFAIRAQREARHHDGRNVFWDKLGIVIGCLLENELPLEPERVYKSAAKLANRRLADNQRRL